MNNPIDQTGIISSLNPASKFTCNLGLRVSIIALMIFCPEKVTFLLAVLHIAVEMHLDYHPNLEFTLDLFSLSLELISCTERKMH